MTNHSPPIDRSSRPAGRHGAKSAHSPVDDDVDLREQKSAFFLMTNFLHTDSNNYENSYESNSPQEVQGKVGHGGFRICLSVSSLVALFVAPCGET